MCESRSNRSSKNDSESAPLLRLIMRKKWQASKKSGNKKEKTKYCFLFCSVSEKKCIYAFYFRV